MIFLDFVLILLIAAVAGGIGGLLVGYYPGGLLASILIGIVVACWVDCLPACSCCLPGIYSGRNHFSIPVGSDRIDNPASVTELDCRKTNCLTS
jgi:hypothetical protein